MDTIILLAAAFVAILVLAYFTYRNIVGLDTRLRKIETILNNAEVVAQPAVPENVREVTPPPPAPAHPEAPEVLSENGYVSGWGGESPPVNVERVEPEEEVKEVDTRLEEADDKKWDEESTDDEDDARDDARDDAGDDVRDDESVSIGGSADVGGRTYSEGEDSDEDEDDTENRDVHTAGADDASVIPSAYSKVRVGDLRDALKKANVGFPANAKKAYLVALVEENHIQLSA